MGGTAPVGVVLAGGRGRRLGGDKAIVELEGRALVHYPIEALHSVCDDVAVVAKRDTLLPSLSGIADLWIEPDEPRHPLVGVAHALGLAVGRPILVVAVDLPLVDAAVLRTIMAADPGPSGATVVAPLAYGRLQPLCALYTPGALAAGLNRFDPSARTIEVVESLGVRVVEGLEETAFFNVNAPEDVLRASVLIKGASPR
ncbi:MAG TPA: NTP transferase domain-containing protein [Baekduia sp.]|uniref:NTP transferase domain-containing protein n=1 Tax=Baekduia sp. TaxID=2600305 RepID=UPI002D7931B7|nr:NTP transferase domain-containing protein [Baekduia sp.]HET6505775.1 NTP transferase domain-containing protein [Baekduia sp.]